MRQPTGLTPRFNAQNHKLRAVLQARGILTSRFASRTHERDACSEKHCVGQAERGEKRMQRRCVPKVPSPVRRALGESACSATPLSRTHSDPASSCFNSQTAMATMMNSRSSLTAKLPQKDKSSEYYLSPKRLLGLFVIHFSGGLR